jgi:hypothetical protein
VVGGAQSQAPKDGGGGMLGRRDDGDDVDYCNGLKRAATAEKYLNPDR